MKWLLAFHIVGVILWTGGLLMLSRVLGYHAGETGDIRSRLARLEDRLHLVVVLPGLGLVLATGLPLLFLSAESPAGFVHVTWRVIVKFSFVAVLFAAHLFVLRRLDSSPSHAPTSPLPYKILHMLLGSAVIGIILVVKVR